MANHARAALAGLAGGIAGTLAMNLLSRSWTALQGRGHASLNVHGGRPDVDEAKQQGKSAGDRDALANTKVAEAIAEPLLGRNLTPEERHVGGQMVHYTYGALLGAAYGLLSEKAPVMRSARGTLFGLGAWLGGVNVVLPLLGLIKHPRKYSLSQHAFAALSHAGYGLALESTIALVDRDGRASQPSPLSQYLQDAIAAEQSFETQLLDFAAEASSAEAGKLYELHAQQTRRQYEDLTARLKALGGRPSRAKSLLAHKFAASPKIAQMASKKEERTVQNLIIAFSVENAEVAMYEALISVAESAGDRDTVRLARTIQREEKDTAEKLWRLIAPCADEAIRRVSSGDSGKRKAVLVQYLQDAEAAERNFEDALRTFSLIGDRENVKGLLSSMSGKARTQHERLESRIRALGGQRSAGKSALAHLLAFTPVSAQIGHQPSEKNTQHLIITYAAAAAEMAMYEALQSAANALGDKETAALARQLQNEEKDDHKLAWQELAQTARESFQSRTRAA